MKLLGILFIGLVCYLIFGSLVIYEIEYQVQDTKIDSYLDAIWWASETLTTVGYGQTIPVSEEGKIFGIFYMWIGVGFSGSMITFIAKSFLINRRNFKVSTITETKVEIIKNISNIELYDERDIEYIKSLFTKLEKQLKETKK